MTEQEIRQIIEEVDPGGKIPQSTMDELVVALREPQVNKTPEVGPTGGDLLLILQEKLKGETDWKKRAAIVARIISVNLYT